MDKLRRAIFFWNAKGKPSRRPFPNPMIRAFQRSFVGDYDKMKMERDLLMSSCVRRGVTGADLSQVLELHEQWKRCEEESTAILQKKMTLEEKNRGASDETRKMKDDLTSLKQRQSDVSFIPIFYLIVFFDDFTVINSERYSMTLRAIFLKKTTKK
jgi:hypothetical protein